MCYNFGMNYGLLLPVLVVYSVGCMLLNWGINLLNVAWRDAHEIRPEQVPEPIARWMQGQPGIKVFRGAAGHPFTALTVIVGMLWTIGAVTVAVLVTEVISTPLQTIGVVLFFLAVGGVIMTAGDALRYLQHG